MKKLLRKLVAFATAVAISQGAHAGLSGPANTQIPAVTTGTYTAPSGFLGFFVQGAVLVGSAVSLTSGVAANVTSISVPAGDWIVWGDVNALLGATTVVTSFNCSHNNTSATLSAALAGSGGIQNGSASTLSGCAIPLGIYHFTTTTTVFLVVQATFTTSTMAAYGNIVAFEVP